MKKTKSVVPPVSYFTHGHTFLDNYMNSNKYFIGLSMIILNVGSKFISIQFSKSSEEYLKMTVTKQILVFSMCFMGTRCVITSLILTATFTILSDHLFNEESQYCVMPHKYRVLHKLIDTNNDGEVSEEELNTALQLLEKSKKEKLKKEQKNSFMHFHDYTAQIN